MKQRSHDDFDAHAKQYRPLHDRNLRITGSKSSAYTDMKADLLAQEEKALGGVWIDWGCGDGLTTLKLAERIQSGCFIGYDPSKESIDIAKQQHRENLSFHTFNGFDIPEKNESADVVLLSCVLHHVAFDQHDLLLQEVNRILKPGGRVYIIEHNPYNPGTRYLVHTCPFDHDAVLLKPGYTFRLLRKTGFRKLQSDYITFFPRSKWFRWLWPLEKWLGWMPLGGQYFLRGLK